MLCDILHPKYSKQYNRCFKQYHYTVKQLQPKLWSNYKNVSKNKQPQNRSTS